MDNPGIRSVPVREVVSSYIGGGWGTDTPDEKHDCRVAVIRGADFPSFTNPQSTDFPIRFEPSKKVKGRSLKAGDIVLEISGGSSDRPTGRTVIVTQRLLDRYQAPLIPASFCRLMRINRSIAHSDYLYYWFQDMFNQGRTWNYQNRSTGIANFQFEYFLDEEQVLLPELGRQESIARVLRSLDDKIESNQRQIENLHELAVLKFACQNPTRSLPLGEVAEVTMGSSPKGTSLNEQAVGTVFYQGTRDFGFRYPSRRVWTTEPTRMAEKGDTLVAVRAPVGTLNRAPEQLCVGRGLAAVKSEYESLIYYAVLDAKAEFEPYNSEGTVFGSINKKAMNEIHVRWPDDPKTLDSQLQTFDELIRSYTRQNDILRSLRDTLLPELLSGRITPEQLEAGL